MNFYPIIIQEHQDFKVVRGDLYPGGLKCRVLTQMLHEEVAEEELVYAGCYFGHSSFALGTAGLLTGKRITLFFPSPVKDTYIHRMVQGLNNVQCVTVDSAHQDEVFEVAKSYAQISGARLLPIGFDSAPFTDRYISVIRRVCSAPVEVWLSGGSGVTARCMKAAWSTTNINVVDLNIRSKPNFGCPTKVWSIPEKLYNESTLTPPWPAARYYDAKVWQIVNVQAKPGALVWCIA